MKKIILLFFSAIFLLQIFSCQKKMSGHVEVSGRLINYYTGEPIAATVVLRADDATSAKDSQRASQTLCSVKTNGDGSFTLRSRPSKKSSYYLFIDGDPYDTGRNYDGQIDLSVNKKSDLGEIKWGSKIFYCDITLVSAGDSCIDVQSYNNAYREFSKGTSLTYRDSVKYTYTEFLQAKGNYLLGYRKSDCVNKEPYSGDYKFYYVQLPISQGVLTTTITY
jgi:hypothetical protein